MRNLLTPKLEHLGTYQVGVRSYYVQRYYPGGGNASYVYVFRKGDPSRSEEHTSELQSH